MEISKNSEFGYNLTKLSLPPQKVRENEGAPLVGLFLCNVILGHLEGGKVRGSSICNDELAISYFTCYCMLLQLPQFTKFA